MQTDSLYIAGQWKEGNGPSFESRNPCTGDVIWKGNEADQLQISDAVSSAQQAFKKWSRLPFEERKQKIFAVHSLLESRKKELASAISLETGKPYWESHAEMARVLDKFDISLEAYLSRTPEQKHALASGTLFIRHKPHGVAAVYGPFNIPVHLSNGHIIPVLLAGNTIVFKPSELTPSCCALYVKCLHDAGIPPGVVNMLQGGPTVGAALAADARINGVFFTGSWQTGRKLMEASLPFPRRITALEMGGNNPLIIWDSHDIATAAEIAVLSAFISTGQRCTCARRLILPSTEEGKKILNAVINLTRSLLIGPPESNPEPFMGPLISAEAVKKLETGYHGLISQGAVPLLPLEPHTSGHGFVRPSILDVTHVSHRDDVEHFGPLLQIYWAQSFDEAIEIANDTSYGLSSAIVTDNPDLYQKFWEEINAGVVNWNSPTTGISSKAPFGGVGKSGNFRPGAYYAADYSAYPVSSMEAPAPIPSSSIPGLTQEKPR